MRIISQDGLVDLPYDRMILGIGENAIYASDIDASNDIRWKIAEYSSFEKARKAMSRLHMMYQKVVTQTERGGLVHYTSVPKVWKFPADNEIEG